MRKNLKKIIASFLIAFLIFTIIPNKAQAADSLWFHQEYPEWYVKTFDPSNPTEIFGERYTAAQVQWIFYSIPAHLLTALTLGRPEPWICIFSADLTSCITGAVQVLREVIERIYNFFGFPLRLITQNENYTETENDNKFSVYSFFYNNPLSGTGYILKKITKITSLPEAKAQGFGYTQGGAAVQKLWQVTRNMSYILLVIAIIILALMIMLRIKITPQAALTIQLALPKVIIGLILITFSYAIAGFLIDLMYVVIGIISSVIKATGLVDNGYSTTELFNDLTKDRNVFILSWHYVITFLIGTLATILSQGFFGGIIMLFLFIVVLIATIFNSVKILWLMIRTYVSIILSIVTAPLQILIGIVSPSSGFGQWSRSFIANLAVYPTVGVMFFLAFFFIVQAIGGSMVGDLLARAAPFQILPRFLESTTSWDPPLTWGTNSGRFLWMLASFGIYMIIPKTADIIKSMIEGKPFASYGTAIGEAISPVIGLGRAGLQSTATYTDLRLKKIPEGESVPRGYQRLKIASDALKATGVIK